MKIEVSRLIEYDYVEVLGKAARTKTEFVVYINRHGMVTGGYRFTPDECYVSVADLPADVKLAAEETYKRRYERSDR